MSCLTSLPRTTLVVMLAISLFVFTGCDPKSKPPAPAASTPEATSTSTKETPSAVEDSGAITGPLESVDWESLVGQKVAISGKLEVVDTYDLVRRGQIKVARQRIFIPTNSIDPNDKDPNATSFEGGSNVAQVVAAQKVNDQATLTLDDGSDEENIFPPQLFPKLGQDHPTVRIGSSLNGVTGTLMKQGGNFVLIPTEPLSWTPAERPQRPDVGPAKITVASFNVLNYFTTIDNGRNQARGADSAAELKRQEAKLVSAIIALEADVIGLMELENNLDAEQRLVAALNAAVGEQVYQGSGLPEGFRDSPGGDNAIRVGLIYRSDRVTPVGAVAMISDPAFENARAPIVQTFQADSISDPFTVIVNHLKSKGGSSNADPANKDKGDGQGAHNASRRGQALAICNYITGLGDQPRVLVIGDLNAYGQEDPIDALRAKGLVDLHQAESTSSDQQDYSFIYYGQGGSLDHALATPALAEDVTGVATWHINADEPRFLDYNQEYNPEPLFEVNPFRSSDHDPMLIGIGN